MQRFVDVVGMVSVCSQMLFVGNLNLSFWPASESTAQIAVQNCEEDWFGVVQDHDAVLTR